MTPENLIEVQDLWFSYGDRPVLKGVDMVAPRGEVVAIMGNSGCGKTTLLRHIGGDLKPTRGCVRVSGRVMHELAHAELYAMRRRIGMLFQFGALFTDISVLENVAFPLREPYGPSGQHGLGSRAHEAAYRRPAWHRVAHAVRAVRRHGPPSRLGQGDRARSDAGTVR